MLLTSRKGALSHLRIALVDELICLLDILSFVINFSGPSLIVDRSLIAQKWDG